MGPTTLAVCRGSQISTGVQIQPKGLFTCRSDRGILVPESNLHSLGADLVDWIFSKTLGGASNSRDQDLIFKITVLEPGGK